MIQRPEVTGNPYLCLGFYDLKYQYPQDVGFINSFPSVVDVELTVDVDRVSF